MIPLTTATGWEKHYEGMHQGCMIVLIIISMNRVMGIYHQVEVERDWRRGEVVEKRDGERERECYTWTFREHERLYKLVVNETIFKRFILFLFLHIFVHFHMHMSVCVCVPTDIRRMPVLFKLEIWKIRSHLMWVLGNKLPSSKNPQVLLTIEASLQPLIT